MRKLITAVAVMTSLAVGANGFIVDKVDNINKYNYAYSNGECSEFSDIDQKKIIDEYNHDDGFFLKDEERLFTGTSVAGIDVLYKDRYDCMYFAKNIKEADATKWFSMILNTKLAVAAYCDKKIDIEEVNKINNRINNDIYMSNKIYFSNKDFSNIDKSKYPFFEGDSKSEEQRVYLLNKHGDNLKCEYSEKNIKEFKYIGGKK